MSKYLDTSKYTILHLHLNNFTLVLDLVGDTVGLLSGPLLLIVDHVLLLRILVSVKTNSVPGEVKETVHVLQATTTGLGNGEPNPGTTNDSNGRKAPESTLGGDTARAARQKHVWHGSRIAVLVGKMKGHSPRCGEGTDSEREQLGSKEVLHGVPAQGPTEARNVNHSNSTSASSLLAFGKDEALNDTQLGDSSEECCDIDHGNGLESDTGKQRTLSANNIDQEQSTQQGGKQLDNTENCGDKQTLLAAGNTENLKQIRSVQSDGTSTGPLAEELNHRGEVKSEEVGRDKEELLNLSEPANAAAGLKLVVEGGLDCGNLANDVVAVCGLVSEVSHDLCGLDGLALLKQVTGRLKLEEAEDENDARHDNVQTGWHQPLVALCVRHIDVAAVIGEISEHNA